VAGPGVVAGVKDLVMTDPEGNEFCVCAVAEL